MSQQPPPSPLPVPVEAKRREELVPLDRIVRSKTNRVAVVDAEFRESIRRDGVLQNVLLRPIKATIAHVTELGGKVATGEEILELVSGERRWLASKQIGGTHIPAVIKHLTDTQALELQIDENRQREDPNPIEQSRQWALLSERYIEDHKKAGEKNYAFKQAVRDIAERYKTGERVVYQTIQLQDLTPAAKQMVENESISYSHGVELCRCTHEDQTYLIGWLLKEREHSHGDLPAVRRLQREIDLLKQQNEEKKRQEKLFADDKSAESKIAGTPGTASGKSGSGEARAAAAPVNTTHQSAVSTQPPVQASAPIGRRERLCDIGRTKVTFDGKTIDLAPGELPASIIFELNRRGHACSSARIEPERTFPVKLVERNGRESFTSVQALQMMLRHPVQPSRATVDPPLTPPKPLTAAAKRKMEQAEAKRLATQLKQERQERRDRKIEERARIALFMKLATKAQFNHRTLASLIPKFLFEFWEDGGFSPALFAPQLLGWPEPKPEPKAAKPYGIPGEAHDPHPRPWFLHSPQPGDYSCNEVRNYAAKHNKKFTPGLLVALLLFNIQAPAEVERLARYYSIDPKKLRKAAAAEIDAERLKVPEPPKDGKDLALYEYLTVGWHGKEWDKLRKTGASDTQVRELLCRHFGEWGSSSGPGKVPITHKGTSNNPRVWFKSSYNGAQKADLAGAELIAKVRELLNIEAA